MRLDNLQPQDIMQWYSERRITPGECAEMLEDFLLERKEDTLLNRIAILHKGYKDSYITANEYCQGLYNLTI